MTLHLAQTSVTKSRSSVPHGANLLIERFYMTSLMQLTEMQRLRVAVIGAGAAGLVALRHLRDDLDTFQPVAFEQTTHVGGTWVYTDDIGIDSTTGRPVHSSMYRNLHVNIPKEVSPTALFCALIKYSLDLLMAEGQW